VATKDLEGIVYVWNFENGSKLAQIECGESSVTFQFTYDSKYLILKVDKRIKIWNISTKALVAEVEHMSYIYSTVVSNNSKYLVSTSEDKTVKITEIETGALAGYYLHSEYAKSAVITKENRYLFATFDNGCYLRVFDLETEEEVSDIKVDSCISWLEYISDQGYLVGVEVLQKIYIWKINP
jgi:WD40 repeat protein